MVASRAAAGAAEDDEVTTMSDFDFEPEDAADVLREPIPPETVEAAYRRGFADAVKQLAYGGAPMSAAGAEAWADLCKAWRGALYNGKPAGHFPPRPEDALSELRTRRALARKRGVPQWVIDGERRWRGDDER
ncbi:MAG: hypothetical protein KF815_01320 [Rhodospirillales bacterium]|nr:hypothetical protein [Rhodospirillales bacterium]